ncbi:MAG TPA: DUF6441 family protein [Rhizomicrobium sp.]
MTRPIAIDIATAATGTMDEVNQGLKNELRDQVRAAGLGDRLANTWRGRRYPMSGASIEPAVFVWSAAPRIVDAFDRAPLIRPVNGRRYLAIPTENVPRTSGGHVGGSRRMTPEEVETAFNQDLKFARAGNGRLVAYVDVVGTAAGGFKHATGKQLARLYRGGKAPARLAQVVMFVLTPTAQMPKRLGIDAAANHWADQVQTILERRLSGS